MTLQFPSCFIWTEVIPLHFYLSNGAILEKKIPHVENTIRFHLKISFRFYLNIIPVDHMSSIVHILFQYGNMKDILRLGGKANWYAIGPTLANISNGPQYLGANLAQLPNLKELF